MAEKEVKEVVIAAGDLGYVTAFVESKEITIVYYGQEITKEWWVDEADRYLCVDPIMDPDVKNLKLESSEYVYDVDDKRYEIKYIHPVGVGKIGSEEEPDWYDNLDEAWEDLHKKGPRYEILIAYPISGDIATTDCYAWDDWDGEYTAYEDECWDEERGRWIF